MNHKEEIRKELASISPYLSGLEFRPAFKVPKGYFEELPDMILESVSPLAELKKDSAFSVPENYFDSLPDLVMARVTPERDTETVVAPPSHSTSNWMDDLINSVAVLFQPRYALRLATVAILLIGGFIFLQNQSNTNSTLASAETDPMKGFDITSEDLNNSDLAYLLDEENTISEFDDSKEIDDLLDDLLKDLDEISDEDLEGFM